MSDLRGLPGQVRNRNAGSTIHVPTVAVTDGSVSGFRPGSRKPMRFAVFSSSPRSGGLRRRSRRQSDKAAVRPCPRVHEPRQARVNPACGPALSRTEGCRARSARCGLRSIAGPTRRPPSGTVGSPTPGSSGSRRGKPTSLPSNADAAATGYGSGTFAARAYAFGIPIPHISVTVRTLSGAGPFPSTAAVPLCRRAPAGCLPTHRSRQNETSDTS